MQKLSFMTQQKDHKENSADDQLGIAEPEGMTGCIGELALQDSKTRRRAWSTPRDVSVKQL